MKSFLTILLFGLGSMASQAAVIIDKQSNIALNQSYTDKLNGIVPVITVTSGTGHFTPGASTFTDATSATAPTANTSSTGGYIYAANITFDLGAAGDVSKPWQLNSFVVWLAAGDGSRLNFIATLSTSLDNITFTQIAGTYVAWGSPYSTNYNSVTYTFAPGDVPAFRYLQLNSTASNGVQPRYVETDGFVSLVPEPSTWALLAFSLTAVMVFRRRRVA